MKHQYIEEMSDGCRVHTNEWDYLEKRASRSVEHLMADENVTIFRVRGKR